LVPKHVCSAGIALIGVLVGCTQNFDALFADGGSGGQCGSSMTCAVTCGGDGGSCYTCDSPSGCSTTCTEGSCDVACSQAQGCHVTCAAGAACRIKCSPANLQNCVATCEGGDAGVHQQCNNNGVVAQGCNWPGFANACDT
jgi:hypothetical protein